MYTVARRLRITNYVAYFLPLASITNYKLVLLSQQFAKLQLRGEQIKTI